jgi:hypothetical protein
LSGWLLASLWEQPACRGRRKRAHEFESHQARTLSSVSRSHNLDRIAPFIDGNRRWPSVLYTSTIVDDEAHCMKIMKGMEAAFSNKDENYFVEVLKKEPSLVLRVHAVCILAEVGGAK